MRTLCLLLLKLSPSRFRRDFTDEVLDIISVRCKEEGRSFRFVISELLGLVQLAWSMRTTPPATWPILGGLGVAATLHLVLYSIIAALLRAFSKLFNPLNQFSTREGVEPVTIGIYAIFGLLTLIPLFLLLAFRIRHARTPRSLKVI
jgi:hypothetical protein